MLSLVGGRHGFYFIPHWLLETRECNLMGAVASRYEW